MLRKNDVIIIAAIAALLMSPKSAKGEGKSFLGDTSKPRGIRNNNPGNLKLTNIPWKGKIPNQFNTDGIFEQFENWYYGVRAMWKDISGDILEGKNTIRKLITEYSATDREAYIDFVSAFTGIGKDSRLSDIDMYSLLDAMSRFENGRELGRIISMADFAKAKVI